MKIVFFGTPDYVVPILEAVHKHFKTNFETPIVAVVTKKPFSDQDGKQIFSEVDHWAHKRKLPKFYSSREFIEAGLQADLGILASYSEIIPEPVIKFFKYGILNLHPSLLPLYRGASPVPAALAMGDVETGVSIIKLDRDLDHGDIMTAFREPVLPFDTYESLRDRLFNHGAEALVEMLPAYTTGKIKPKPQNHQAAVFTRELLREDGFIPTELLITAMTGKAPATKFAVPFIKFHNEVVPDATFVERYLRALTPWPGLYTLIPQRLKILKVHVEEGKLIIDTVQLEGKNEVTFKQFVEGYPTSPFGDVLHHE